MSDRNEFDVDWAEAPKFTWLDYVWSGVTLAALAAFVWWVGR